MSNRSTRSTLVLLGVNFVSSVAIVWVNKLAYLAGFTYPLTLTIFHFVATFFGLYLFSYFRKSPPLPIVQAIPISIAFCGFVVFNNLSLQLNSVGTYQLLKVLTTPVVVLIQRVLYREQSSVKIILSLIPICAGVGLATATTIDTNPYGLTVGLVGVLSTSIYQVWVKTEQIRLKCDSEQLLLYQAPLSAVGLILVSPVAENPLWMHHTLTNAYMWSMVLFSAILALIVNLSIFRVISETSPLSYNVLGHGKLCFILISDYLLFNREMTIRHIGGVCLTVSGIVWYTHIKMGQKRD